MKICCLLFAIQTSIFIICGMCSLPDANAIDSNRSATVDVKNSNGKLVGRIHHNGDVYSDSGKLLGRARNGRTYDASGKLLLDKELPGYLLK